MYCKNSLLLQHSDKKKQGHWDFPKGHVEDGETELQTALRELAEETGITDVEVFPDFNHKISYHIMKEGRRVFKAPTRARLITQSMRFFTKEDVLSRHVAEFFREGLMEDPH